MVFNEFIPKVVMGGLFAVYLFFFSCGSDGCTLEKTSEGA